METHAEDFQDAIDGKQPYEATLTIWSETPLVRDHLDGVGNVLQGAMTAIEQWLYDEGVEDVTVELAGPNKA